MNQSYDQQFQAWLKTSTLTEQELRAEAAREHGVPEAEVTQAHITFIQRRKFWNDTKFWESVQ